MHALSRNRRNRRNLSTRIRHGDWINDFVNRPHGTLSQPRVDCVPSTHYSDYTCDLAEEITARHKRRRLNPKQGSPTAIPSTDVHSTGILPSAINMLAPEILLQILRHVLPTGHLYHIFPRTRGMQTVAVIQQLVPYADHDAVPQRYFTAVLLANRRLYHEAMSILYGENSFVFNLTTKTQLFSQVYWDGIGLESWCTALPRPQSSVWPITVSSAQYITKATFVVSFTAGASRLYDLHGLRRTVNEAVLLFCPRHSLREVHIHFKLFSVEESITALKCNVVDGCVSARTVSETRPYVLEWERAVMAGHSAELVRVLQPFERLNGIREVRVSGERESESTRRIAARMMTGPD